MSESVLIIDTERTIDAALEDVLTAAGLHVEIVDEGWPAIEKLRQDRFTAVILDPMIRHRLNGYAVLSFIELEQRHILDRLFLLTGMSEQTIARTAPRMLHRLFRKPCDLPRLTAAVLAACGQTPEVRHVLIIEDDSVTAATLESLVRELGYDVTWARDGREALERMFNADYAAVLLDLVLPEIDGFDVIERVRGRKAEMLQRMIITTGVPEEYLPDIAGNCLCGVVRKPVQAKDLTTLLQRAVGRDAA